MNSLFRLWRSTRENSAQNTVVMWRLAYYHIHKSMYASFDIFCDYYTLEPLYL